jgi:hypothetical protein
MPTSGALGAVYSAIGKSSIFSFRDARTPSRNRDQRAACVLAALPNHRAIPCLPSDFAFATLNGITETYGARVTTFCLPGHRIALRRCQTGRSILRSLCTIPLLGVSLSCLLRVCLDYLWLGSLLGKTQYFLLNAKGRSAQLGIFWRTHHTSRQSMVIRAVLRA